MKPDNQNFILAIVLSMAIIFGWQYFYVAPQLKQQEQTAVPPAPGQPSTAPGPVPGTATAVTVTRKEALAASPRIAIETPTLTGSLNLKGAQIDDLSLKNYHVTVNPGSPIITYLSPSGSPGALFAEFGWFAPEGYKEKLPGPDTLWQAPANAVLTPATPVVLTWDNGEGITFKRTISIDGKYLFTLKDEVVNARATPLLVHPYGRVLRQGTPMTEGIWVLYEGPHGVLDGVEQRNGYSDLQGAKEPISVVSTGGWLGFTDKYWAISLIPDQKLQVKGQYLYGKDAKGEFYQTHYQGHAVMQVAPGSTGTITNNLFAGAKVVGIVDEYKAKLGITNFDLLIDWGWFYPITKPLFYLIDWLNHLIGNFGLAMLVITVLVKLVFFPLQNKSYESMSKMKKLQPEMEKLKEVHKDDKMKLQQAMMELYKKEKVSPLSGCVPILIQIPVFFALYKVIYTTIDLRHAPFFGWIHDLSAPDPTSLFNLFGLLPFAPPSFLVLGVWPILMGITMWMQMRLNPTPPDPVQAAMFNWMPLIFTFMMASFPAGLIIYWTWNNLLSILQQSYIMKRNGVEINYLGNIRESLPFLFKKKPAG